MTGVASSSARAEVVRRRATASIVAARAIRVQMMRPANAVPMPAISASLFARFESRQEDSNAMKAVAALRNQFGGHSVKKA